MTKSAYFFFFIVLIATLGWLGFAWLDRPLDEKGEKVVFEVHKGSLRSHSKRLQEARLILSSWHFEIFARLSGQTANLRVGEYEVSASMTPSEILAVLTSGKSILRQFTVPEGSNIFEISQIIEKSNLGRKEDFVALCFDRRLVESIIELRVMSCEGFLFPETYSYTKYSSQKEIFVEMLKMFKRNFEEIQSQVGNESCTSLRAEDELSEDQRGTRPPNALTPLQIITLASIIEKETGASEERRTVSSVYHNRLALKMRLQADPTTLYGKMISSQKFETNITKADLRAVNPYNTYAISGLPVGPIASPGRASIYAAFCPVSTEYLYFVSQNDGRHVFSKDFSSHNKAVKSFQLDSRARKGKSWRDLKKRESPKQQILRKALKAAS